MGLSNEETATDWQKAHCGIFPGDFQVATRASKSRWFLTVIRGPFDGSLSIGDKICADASSFEDARVFRFVPVATADLGRLLILPDLAVGVVKVGEPAVLGDVASTSSSMSNA